MTILQWKSVEILLEWSLLLSLYSLSQHESLVSQHNNFALIHRLRCKMQPNFTKFKTCILQKSKCSSSCGEIMFSLFTFTVSDFFWSITVSEIKKCRILKCLWIVIIRTCCNFICRWLSKEVWIDSWAVWWEFAGQLPTPRGWAGANRTNGRSKGVYQQVWPPLDPLI